MAIIYAGNELRSHALGAGSTIGLNFHDWMCEGRKQNPKGVRVVESHLWQRTPKMGHPAFVSGMGTDGFSCAAEIPGW
jgi:hypothetical protein